MDDPSSAATDDVGAASELTRRSDAATLGPGAHHPGHGLAPGDTLGRYVLVERIGFGGMGEVYRAFDPELGRLVAIKHVLGDQVDEADQRRLQQEAMAIAQLSHPNVVQVYDVGRDKATRRVFIAMEYVEGLTLRKWVEHDRTVEEIVGCYVLAGRGLAAAHERGIVHRDFKPANVLVDQKGRPKVLDFGLALPSAGNGIELSASLSRQIEAAGQSSGSYALLRGLTGAGGRLGTPAYMSPEQFAGLDTDTRADQFSFAVSLYEALHGRLPFAGKTVEAYACAVIDGDAQPPPRRPDVPKHVSEALERALDPDPDKRFPTMEALLAELERVPSAARKTWLTVAVMTVVAAGGVVWGSIRANGESDAKTVACQRAFAQAGATLDASAVAQTIASADRPFAEDLSTRASGRLDAVHRRWHELTELECTSPASGSLGDARRLCLSRHGARERRLLEVLEDPSPADLDHVMDAIVGLETHLDGCEDPGRLEALTPATAMPPEQRDEILDALERVELASVLGRYSEARTLLESLGADQETWPVPLRYDWLVRAMRIEMEAGSTQAAAVLFDDHVSALAEGGLDPVRRRELDHQLGMLRMYQEQHEASDRAFRRYHEACRAALGPDHRDTILAQAALGHAPDATGQYERAHALYLEADEAGRSAGLEVVDRMTLRANVALSAAHLGDLELAREAYEDVLQWSIEQNGDRHPDTEMARFDVAYVLLRAGEGEAAAAMFGDWLERMRSDPGWHSPLEEVSALGNLGAAHLVAGEPEKAEAALREALELVSATRGDEASQQAISLSANLGALLDGQGRHEDAVVVLARAVSMVDETGTAATHNGVMTRNNLAVAQAKAGDRRGAAQTVEHALGLAMQSGSQELLALTRLRQARVALEARDSEGAEAALANVDAQPLDEDTRARVDAEIARLALPRNQNKRDSEESPSVDSTGVD